MVFVLATCGFGQDWKGFYVGGNAGGAKGVSEEQTTTVFSPTGYFASSSVPAIAIAGDHFLSPRGFTGGGQFGYNVQASHFVLGGEVDFDSLNVSDRYSSSLTYPCCAPTAFTVR